MGNGWDRQKDPAPKPPINPHLADILSDATERFLNDGTTANYRRLHQAWFDYEQERTQRGRA